MKSLALVSYGEGCADPTSATPDDSDCALEFTEIYEQWFAQVARWVTALGGPSADVDDLTQEVFLIVMRKLDAFDGGNLPGWLFQVSRSVVRGHRRRAWFRKLLFGYDGDEAQVPSTITPATELEARQATQELFRVLENISEPKRETFILFEVLGHSGDEVARLQGVPSNTVWTRLHHARKEFCALVKAQNLEHAPRVASDSLGGAA